MFGAHSLRAKLFESGTIHLAGILSAIYYFTFSGILSKIDILSFGLWCYVIWQIVAASIFKVPHPLHPEYGGMFL
jgi:hypothetical protein